MNIAISGATGFIGSYLAAYLARQGHSVISLKREAFRDTTRLAELISPCKIVINLAGAPINRRWTKGYKKELYESRILTTRQLANAINSNQQEGVFISASAVGFYPPSGCYTEESARKGEDFLAELCGEWEKEARSVGTHTRLAITRLGVVLASDGGAFIPMTRPAKAGIATIIGKGDQPFSWIARHDLVRAMDFIINTPSLDGVFNFTAPQNLTQKEFTQQIAEHYHSRATIHVPGITFRLLYGEAAAFITQGQCAIPQRLLNSGFRFSCPTLEQFLKTETGGL